MESNRRRRRFWIATAGMATLSIVALLAAPTLLGTKWLYQPLLDRLKADDFHLEVESVRLRWFTPIVLKGIGLNQQNGPTLLSVSEVRSNRSLLGFLLNGRNLGQIDIIDPTIDIELLSDSTNLTKLIRALEGKTAAPDKAATSEGSAKKLPSLDLDVVVHGFSAKVQRPGEPVPLVIIPPWDLSLAYRATNGASRLVVQPTTVLEKVELTPELIRLGLGHAIPLLADSAWFDGQVSLETGKIEVPLEHPEESIAEGTLTLHRVRSGPSQPNIVQLLDLLARLRDREPNHELVFVDGSQIRVKLAEGKVFHEGLEAGLPKVDDRLQIATSGSVGIVDKSLDLTLQCPVPLALLAKRPAVQGLGIPSVRVPIAGTLEKPVVQWNVLREDSGDLLSVIREKVKDDSPGASAILGALEKVAEGEADEAISFAADLFKEFRNKRKENSKNAQLSPDERNEPSEPARPVRDALRDLLRGKKD